MSIAFTTRVLMIEFTGGIANYLQTARIVERKEFTLWQQENRFQTELHL